MSAKEKAPESEYYYIKALILHKKHGLDDIDLGALRNVSKADAFVAAEHVLMDIEYHLSKKDKRYNQFLGLIEEIETLREEERAKALGVVFELTTGKDALCMDLEKCMVSDIVDVTRKWSLDDRRVPKILAALIRRK